MAWMVSFTAFWKSLFKMILLAKKTFKPYFLSGLRHPFKVLLGLILTGLFSFQSSILLASDEIRILQVTDYQEDQQLLFDSQSQFNLPDAIIEAIHSEVGLIFETEIVFLEHQRFAGIKYHRERMHVQYRTQLRYSSFSNRYTLINERNNKVQTFGSLDEALRTLGTLSSFPVLSLSELHPDQKYTLKLNIHLNHWRLPAPLVLNSLLDSDWQLDSGWFETTIYTPKSWL